MSEAQTVAVREVTVPNKQGLHTRPVMKFVDLASRFRSSISVSNVSRNGEKVDGKSAMHMMLLEATQGSVLRIEVRGDDAVKAADALMHLVATGFETDSRPT